MSEEILVVDRLANDLRSRIKSGEYGTSGTLPTTTELAKLWSVPRSIVTQVMLLLRSEGSIRAAGNRYAVNYPRLVFTGIPKDFGQYLRDRGFEPIMENLVEPTLEEMPPDIASLFGQPSGVHVIHRIRKQSMRKDGLSDYPLRIAENWYPASLAEQFLDAMRANENIHVIKAIKEAHGLYIVRTKEDISARIPTIQEAEWLNLARYQPVLEALWTNYAADGQVLMFNRIIMVGTNFTVSREYPVTYWEEQQPIP